MLFITGDTHIPVDISKLNSRRFPAQKELTKNDYLIICGDFGGVWDGGREDLYWRRWLDRKNFTTLFIDGNHENFDLLRGFETVDFCGGRAHRISDSIYHLMRGQIYSIDGRSIFSFGGAQSHDRAIRTEGISWWREELPSEAEINEARANLDAAGRRVDIVLTHCAPTSVQSELSPGFEPDVLTEFLEELAGSVSFDGWYFGHYHTDRLIKGRFHCMYENIDRIPHSDF